MSFIKNPITKKRLSRFKAIKRAYVSFWIICILYFISLGAELICNNNPLYVRFNGDSFFPIFKFYPEDIFLKNGKKTRLDYKKLNENPLFKNNPDNFMIFSIFAFGPYESIDQKSIIASDNVTVSFRAMLMVGAFNINKNYGIENSYSFGSFIKKNDQEIKSLNLLNFVELPQNIKNAIQNRFDNRKSLRISYKTQIKNAKVIISIPEFLSREYPPDTVRLTFREEKLDKNENQKIVFNNKVEILQNSPIYNDISDNDKKIIFDLVKKRTIGPLDSVSLSIKNRYYTVSFLKQDINFPYPPINEHFMGIDSAGRDVFARIFYGLRTSLTFGLMLVIFSIIIGIIVGSIQGYYAGIIDITTQRFIEIWSSLPFLYIMILLGSVYGRGFILLLVLYGIFNWIGISYYVRAEFLKLRKQPFVEAAKCMGISSFKIIFRHILPNALVPVITFFPFLLVGAIGSLAALDYLGFGLPAPTASWGELLFQAQQYRWAWWLILYPSLSLFVVMMLGVFIGEGIRDAYDPRKYSKLE